MTSVKRVGLRSEQDKSVQLKYCMFTVLTLHFKASGMSLNLMVPNSSHLLLNIALTHDELSRLYKFNCVSTLLKKSLPFSNCLFWKTTHQLKNTI